VLLEHVKRGDFRSLFIFFLEPIQALAAILFPMKPRVIHLDHIQLAAPAGCELAARDFYGSLLGMAEIEKPEALRA